MEQEAQRHEDEGSAAIIIRAIRETAAEMREKYQGDIWRLAQIDALEKMSLAVVGEERQQEVTI